MFAVIVILANQIRGKKSVPIVWEEKQSAGIVEISDQNSGSLWTMTSV